MSDELTGVERIARERQRQIEVENFCSLHDDAYVDGELQAAAVCYVTNWYCSSGAGQCLPPSDWPWDKSWWRPSDNPIRNLEKAGVLIAAEIDRLQRLEER